MSQSVMENKTKLFATFKVKVTARAYMIKIWLILLYLLNCWFFGNQTFTIYHRKPECLAGNLDYCIQGQGHSERSKCQCLSRWYLQNRQTFCYQTWHCDASSARVSCKKIGLLFSRSRSQQGFIWSKYDSFYYIFWTADSFAAKLGLMVHHYKSCEKDCIALLWSKSRSQEGIRIPVNVFLDNISSTAEPFVTKLCMVMYHHGPECNAKRVVYSYNQIWLCLPYLLSCCSFCSQI